MSRATQMPRRLGERRERRAHRAAGRRVELVGHGAANVVGLEDRVEVGHGVQATHRRSRRLDGASRRRWHHVGMSDERRRGITVWLTGLPGSGKTTSALFLLDALLRDGISATSLDGDVLRAGISADLGFGPEDRDENVRRAGEIALLLATAGRRRRS